MPSELSYPIHLAVSSPNTRRQTGLICPHVHTGKIPDWGFVEIGDGMAVSAPPFCFFQMAGELPLGKLIALGLEFCGTYSLSVKGERRREYANVSGGGGGNRGGGGGGDGNGNGGGGGNRGLDGPGQNSDGADKTIYNHPRLTNTKELKAFTSRMKGVGGQKKASKALMYIADGAASPMETILFVLLTLPYKYGGYGFPAPELNRRINFGRGAKQRANKAYYVCDFYWPEAGLAVEYDSNLHHTGADRIAEDSKRRTDLSALGIYVVTATNEQIRSIDEFERLARLIAKRLGKQLRYKNPEFLRAQRELRDFLL
ncbi:MAG: endonuclease domain-containing protein [Clostridiales bacterium]|nr:endonuclease domain-containing protein [Clostridiales bacterium]